MVVEVCSRKEYLVLMGYDGKNVIMGKYGELEVGWYSNKVKESYDLNCFLDLEKD